MTAVDPVVKLAGFAVILLASFGAAFGVGRLVGDPDTTPVPAPVTVVTTTTMDHGGHS